ncbi:MAG: hypothetical protein ACOCUY_03865, partial [Verrucomicrobiota bacterium]
LAMDNGDPTDLDPFQQPNRRAFNGLALGIVRSRKDQPGPITIRATGEDVQQAAIKIEASTQTPNGLSSEF